MRIGVDFDNTIVCFDPLFYREAVRQNLIPTNTAANKMAVRDALRAQGKEAEWTELQGLIYGQEIAKAEAFSGVGEFFLHHLSKGNDVFIVSHKTQKPALGPAYDLHSAALGWISSQKFLSQLKRDNIFFETSIPQKIERIKKLRCDIFIDDLLEFLTHPNFPENVDRILFSPDSDRHNVPFRQAASWTEIQKWIP